jgi:hypothetical protein
MDFAVETLKRNDAEIAVARQSKRLAQLAGSHAGYLPETVVDVGRADLARIGQGWNRKHRGDSCSMAEFTGKPQLAIGKRERVVQAGIGDTQGLPVAAERVLGHALIETTPKTLELSERHSRQEGIMVHRETLTREAKERHAPLKSMARS